MIGNDIVDLEFAGINSRWREQRFLDKLFSKEEQQFILSEENRYATIWKLWSMKESVYKIISRADGIARFNPKDFNCFVTNAVEGYVMFENRSVPTVTEIKREFIQTIAYLQQDWISESFPLVDSDIEIQSEQIYQKAVKAFAKMKAINYKSLEILKNERGVPQFYIHGILQADHLSLTHHGHFGAFAIAV